MPHLGAELSDREQQEMEDSLEKYVVVDLAKNPTATGKRPKFLNF